MISIFPPKKYRKQIAIEQRFYDTSFRAWILGYDSWYIGRCLLYMRYAEWDAINNNSIIIQ